MQRCVAVIPCRNEAHSIGKLITRVRGHLPMAIVVDDGSKDGTGREAIAAGARILRGARSQGKGSAMAAGWKEAARLGFEWVLFMDGDGQHDSRDIPLFFSVGSPDARLIIGNRMHDSARIPLVRRATNEWMSRQISNLAGMEIPDTQCGFRLAHLPTLQELNLASQHFEVESEMCVEFVRAGHRVAFCNVRVKYGDERSKIGPIRDAVRWFRWYLSARRRFSRAAASPQTVESVYHAQTTPLRPPSPRI